MKIRYQNVFVAAALAAVSSLALAQGNFSGQQPQPGYPAAQGSPQQPGASPQGATADHGLQGHMMTTGDARVQLQQRIGTGPPPGVIRFDRAVIVDASGFEQPLAASTLFIPHG